MQTLEAFQPVIALQGENDAAHRLGCTMTCRMPSLSTESLIVPNR